MATYTKPQQRRKEEGKRLSGKRDQVKFIDLRLEGGQVIDLAKEEESKTFHKLHILGTNDDLWDRVRALGCETWKGCE